MKIAASQVQLTSHHEEYYQSTVEAQVSRSFQDVLATQKKSGENTEREQLAQMLTGLVESMIAALRGEKLSATGESGGISTVSAGKENVPLRSLPKREEVWHWNIAELQQECEQTQVQGSGWICTEDGRNLDFSLCVDMQREYRSEKTISSTEKIALRDPLVINFNGKAAQLSGERIDFDLDVDGLKEKMSKIPRNDLFQLASQNPSGEGVANGENIQRERDEENEVRIEVAQGIPSEQNSPKTQGNSPTKQEKSQAGKEKKEKGFVGEFLGRMSSILQGPRVETQNLSLVVIEKSDGSDSPKDGLEAPPRPSKIRSCKKERKILLFSRNGNKCESKMFKIGKIACNLV